jgi:S1-C subfamily serine protease
MARSLRCAFLAMLSLLIAGMIVLHPGAAVAADAARGKEVAVQWCQSCHQVGPELPMRGPGPPFSPIANDLRFTEDFIKDWVVHPHASMPNFNFGEGTLKDIVAYIFSLREPAAAQCDFCESQAGVRPPASGSGFFIGGDGHILTAAHLVRECRRITVSYLDVFTTAEIERISERFDLAMLRIERQAARFPRLRDFAKIRPGERIFNFSFPASEQLADAPFVSAGYVTSTSGFEGESSHFRMSVDLQFGSSGSPVFDQEGSVVGMVQSRLVSTPGDIVQPVRVNYAVNAETMKLFLAETSHFHFSREVADRPLESHEIAERARRYTVRVRCHR